jgi:DNA-binding transcriptional MerR regulator
MRIKDLSASTGVPIPTIKYYLREGLLSPGVKSSPNQADYDEEHARRLRLIRVLLDLGGLDVKSLKHLLSASGDRAVDRPAPAPDITAVLRARDWLVDEENPTRQRLDDLVAVLRENGHGAVLQRIPHYAAHLQQLVDLERADRPADPVPVALTEALVSVLHTIARNHAVVGRTTAGPRAEEVPGRSP